MAFTFKNLIDELNLSLWPDMEQENLVIPHRRLFVEALVDLQQWDECLRINNTQVEKACDTFFKCGLTVLDAPRGQINALYTLDKINQDTGLEDSTVPTDWCSRVDYRQVTYDDLSRYVSQTLAGALCGDFWGWCGIPGSLAGIVAFPACWAGKYSYPPPTDAGLEKAPPLPLGYHYAQSSTNDPNGVRAQYGLWALKGGQIFIAPWIQSTETVIIEWNGIKRNWDDFDLVDDDPMLKKAVEEYIRWKQTVKYDMDYNAGQAAAQAYQEARANLMYECRKENEIGGRMDGTMEGSGSGSKARGAVQLRAVFVNTAQQAVAHCPQNTTGADVSFTVPAGTVSSTVSQADADSRAQSLALQQAGVSLDCTTIPVTYSNTLQSFTAQCQGGTGNPVTINILPGLYTSTVSQEDADTLALNAATAQAIAALSCSFVNEERSKTASCPAGHPGSDVTKTIPAGTYTSSVSQDDANQQADAAAQTQADLALVCAASPPVYLNTAKLVNSVYVCVTPHGTRTLVIQTNVAAGAFSSLVSQLDANNKASFYANSVAQQALQLACQRLQSGASSPGGGVIG